MKLLTHSSAKASHYTKQAESYDAFNEKNSEQINLVIEKILKKYGVKTVLDLTCGTGSQVFWLAHRGYEVVGSDINAQMLKAAKDKAKKTKLDVKLFKGDMRTTRAGTFDAVITIFNAIGHLTKEDFEKTIQNIHHNLKNGGLYIFDINNLGYLREGNNITALTIDWQKTEGNTTFRNIQYSTIDKDGILASYTTSYVQKGSQEPKVSKESQTLQIYTAQQLKKMLQQNGFKVVNQSGIDGAKFSEKKTKAILNVAKKV